MTNAPDSTKAVVIERVFDAPIDLVWAMWTHADHFKAWYGPDGATIPVADMDVRPGGRRLISMQMATPNGEMRMWFTGEFLDVVPMTRLVYTESMSDEEGTILRAADMGMPPGHPDTTEVTVELAALGGQTTMVLTHAGVPADSPGAMGWMMALDKMTALVGSLS